MVKNRALFNLDFRRLRSFGTLYATQNQMHLELISIYCLPFLKIWATFVESLWKRSTDKRPPENQKNEDISRPQWRHENVNQIFIFIYHSYKFHENRSSFLRKILWTKSVRIFFLKNNISQEKETKELRSSVGNGKP